MKWTIGRPRNGKARGGRSNLYWGHWIFTVCFAGRAACSPNATSLPSYSSADRQQEIVVETVIKQSLYSKDSLLK